MRRRASACGRAPPPSPRNTDIAAARARRIHSRAVRRAPAGRARAAWIRARHAGARHLDESPRPSRAGASGVSGATPAAIRPPMHATQPACAQRAADPPALRGASWNARDTRRVRPDGLAPARSFASPRSDDDISIGRHCAASDEQVRRARAIGIARAGAPHSPHARTTATCTPILAPFAHVPAAFRRFLIHDIKCRLNCSQSVSHREELNRRKRIQIPDLMDLERIRSARFARENRDKA